MVLDQAELNKKGEWLTMTDEEYVKILEAKKKFMEHSIEERRKDHINPSHYKDHKSGIECIQITEHMDFCIGNAVKYLWRAGKKDDNIQDLKKAIWYIERKIKLLGGD